MLKDLFLNLTVFLSALFITHQWFQLKIDLRRTTSLQRIQVGLIYGFIGIVMMSFHTRISPDLVVDLRHLIVLFAGLFGGWLTGITTAIVMSIYRFILFGWAWSSWITASSLLVVAIWCSWVGDRNWNRWTKVSMMISGIFIVNFVMFNSYSSTIANYNSIVMSYAFALWVGGLTAYSLTEYLLESARWVELIKESQKELQQVVKEQQGAIFKFKKEGVRFRYTMFDGQLVYKLDRKPDDFVGKYIDELSFQSDFGLHDHFHKAWEGNEVTYEYRLTNHVLLVLLRPIYHQSEVFEVIGSCMDITAQKLEEEERVTIKERLESLITNSADAIVIFDLQSRVIQANPAFEKIYGWSIDELIGKKIPCMPGQLEELERVIREQIIEGSKIGDKQLLVLTKSGKMIEVSISISPIRDAGGNVIAVSGISRDITERKVMERAIQQSEAKYRAIVEHTSDLIAIFTFNQKLAYVSPSHQQVLGYNMEQFKQLISLDLYHPDDRRFVSHAFYNMFVTPVPTEISSRIRHKDGHWIFLETRMMPVLSKTGELQSVISISRDITRRKQEEEWMIQSEKLSVVGQLASGVAHEIRNPLTTLKGFVQMMKNSEDVKAQYLELMHSELERIEQITNEFLVLAKPQATQFRETNLEYLIEQVVMILNTQAILSNVQIEIHKGYGVPIVLCEANQIKQVLINIGKNAIEAMPRGGTLTIRISREGDQQVSIIVEDQGEGIPEDRLHRLGEPFYSLKEKGTGLGIMVCQKIVGAHKGKMTFFSKVEEGTKVEIILPIGQEGLANSKIS
ncbi:PAS domain S-box protein [Ammoniphilus sp. CFH 90114]|uniref:PAS domain S-box protein n=1 Tax=Ammoniphilus sp. CFH 90114 TaxID=2493665 RepID=UPI00100EC08C|nr:PAS domain S-box protein [Ammoniphilus sp. CFH 90114]RXT15335.1 PAS domain S-box protein [Ammoniphilus sp. CFH 90114]